MTLAAPGSPKKKWTSKPAAMLLSLTTFRPSNIIGSPTGTSEKPHVYVHPPSSVQTQTKRLKPSKWRAAQDPDGRIQNMPKLLRYVLEGGVDHTIRGEVWEFLLGCYEPDSTAEARNELREARRVRYAELVEQCRQMHESIGTGRLAFTVGTKRVDVRATGVHPDARLGHQRVTKHSRQRLEAASQRSLCRSRSGRVAHVLDDEASSEGSGGGAGVSATTQGPGLSPGLGPDLEKPRRRNLGASSSMSFSTSRAGHRVRREALRSRSLRQMLESSGAVGGNSSTGFPPELGGAHAIPRSGSGRLISIDTPSAPLKPPLQVTVTSPTPGSGTGNLSDTSTPPPSEIGEAKGALTSAPGEPEYAQVDEAMRERARSRLMRLSLVEEIMSGVQLASDSDEDDGVADTVGRHARLIRSKTPTKGWAGEDAGSSLKKRQRWRSWKSFGGEKEESDEAGAKSGPQLCSGASSQFPKTSPIGDNRSSKLSSWGSSKGHGDASDTLWSGGQSEAALLTQSGKAESDREAHGGLERDGKPGDDERARDRRRGRTNAVFLSFSKKDREALNHGRSSDVALHKDPWPEQEAKASPISGFVQEGSGATEGKDVTEFSGSFDGASSLGADIASSEDGHRSETSDRKEVLGESADPDGEGKDLENDPVASLGSKATEGRVAEWLWTLHKIVVDVVRTDQHMDYFVLQSTRARMADILAIHAWVDPTTSYCQGMCDLLAPFALLYEDDADAFWSFEHFLGRLRSNFMLEGPVGVMRQLESLRSVLALTESRLLRHLADAGADDLMFAFRMLLVMFRREVSFTDIFLLWEMMWAADYDPSAPQSLVNELPKALCLSSDFSSPREVQPPPREHRIREFSWGSRDFSFMRPGNGRFVGQESARQRLAALHKLQPKVVHPGDEDLPVFFVAAILRLNRKLLLKEVEEPEDAIKIFNEVLFKIEVQSCVQTAGKIRVEYLNKLSKTPKGVLMDNPMP